MNRGTGWTMEATNALIGLSKTDPPLSFGQIADRLGVTKGCVVGKWHRLGLPPRASPIRRPQPVALPESDGDWLGWFNRLPDHCKRAAAEATHTGSCPLLIGGGMWTCTCEAILDTVNNARRVVVHRGLAPVRLRAVEAAPVEATAFKPLPRCQCQWPSGDSPRISFECAELAEPGRPYCAEHWGRSYYKSARQSVADASA